MLDWQADQAGYEGAVKEDGRGKTTWDTFAHTFGKIVDFSNADVAVDQYHRFEEDIQLMADMGMDAYRFSIAWSRILPNGIGQVNQAGIDHYNKLIDALLAKALIPLVITMEQRNTQISKLTSHKHFNEHLVCRNKTTPMLETTKPQVVQ
ncbi:beta-glucosidase 6 [Panicum miliaceum]|uniref:Beta-glucosidase 6 n=1 Tax=Panicum miliaceum TaxID=4540 RepID=A0A3L6TF68_PANMI|nr:beta-glucosidase 6 [Panicum miliaceum]